MQNQGWWSSAGIMQQQPAGLAGLGRVYRDSGQSLSDTMQQPLNSMQTTGKPQGQMGMFGPPQTPGLLTQPASQKQGFGFAGLSIPQPRFGGGL